MNRRTARLALLLSLGTLASSDHSLAQALTEPEVVRLVKLRDPDAQVARRLAAEVAARELEAGLYPNPALGWEREHVPGSGPPSGLQDSVALTVPIELSGRRAAEHALARSETAQARANSARAHTQSVVRALSSFYAAIAAQQRTEIARRAALRIAEAARVLARRFEEGTVAGYELTRIELEAELSQSQLRETEARERARAAELATLLGLDPTRVALRGDLAVGPGIGDMLGPAVPPRSLELARAALSQAEHAEDSAASAWIPSLAASIGLRLASAADESDIGYVAGVSVELPILAHGQDVRARASARMSSTAAQVAALERSAELERQRSAAELALARDELVRFDAATSARLEQLERAAGSAYREGERSLLSLLDAQRMRQTVELRKLELALAAKRAEIALRAAAGEFE